MSKHIPTKQDYGYFNNVFNIRHDDSRKFKLMCTKHKHIFNIMHRRRVKEVLGESWIGYYVRGGMIKEAIRILKLK